MSDAKYMGAAGTFVYTRYYDPSFREGLVLLMEAIDEFAPQVGKSFWSDFVKVEEQPPPDFGPPDWGPYFEEEDLLEWLRKFRLDKWNHGMSGIDDSPPQDFVAPFAYMWDTFFERLGAKIEGVEGPEDEALEECLKTMILGPVFRSWYAPEQLASHQRWMLKNWRRDPTPEFVSASARLAPVYNPVFDSRQKFRRKTERYMTEVEELALREGVKKAPRMNYPKRDFELLARRVVLGETSGDIAEELNLEDASGDYDSFGKVRKAIQRTAKLIGLKLPRGRPPKKSGH